MAVQKHTARTHAAQLVAHLDQNERNALRTILLTKSGLTELREALGTQKMRVLSAAEVATGHAKRGTTIELFRNHDRSPVNLTATDTHATAGKAGSL